MAEARFNIFRMAKGRFNILGIRNEITQGERLEETGCWSTWSTMRETRMARFTKGGLERSALADLFKHTLSRISTTYGRLSYLASLRSPHSGNYQHHGLFAAFGREEGVKALEESHNQVFREWLAMPLQAQHADLTAYFGEQDAAPESIIRHWRQSRVYRSYLPAAASDAEKALYARDLDVLIEILNYAAAAGRGRAS